ncbi:alpha/beta fold hydrolase [Patescibacteria group bacterium]|nr:alpha/beta fold hydrolase [Patescibacteria group bacterium]
MKGGKHGHGLSVFIRKMSLTATKIDKNLNIDIGRVPKDARPFYYKKGQIGIFFVHGFTDSLCRVNGFAKFLASHDISTKGILMPGHGGTWEDLAKTNLNDWYKSVEAGILEMAKDVEDVYVVGISLGGNFALKVAAKHPDKIKGIVTIESPMRIKHQYITRVAIPFAQFAGFKYWKKQYLKRLTHPEKDTVFDQGVLDRMPLNNIAQIIDFLENKQAFLKRVKCDVLIIQSEQSSLVTKSSAQKMYDSVKSKRKEIFYHNNIYHAFLSEPAKKSIFYKAVDFFGIDI